MNRPLTRFAQGAVLTVLLTICVSTRAQEMAEAERPKDPKPSTSQQNDRVVSNETKPSGVEDTELNLTVPEVEKGFKLTLIEALQMAERKNQSLAAARADIETARAFQKKAWSSLFPVLYAGAVYTHFDEETAQTYGGGDPAVYNALNLPVPPVSTVTTNRQNQLSGTAQVDLPIVHPQAWMAIRSANKALALSQTQTAYIRQQLFETVGEMFYQCLGLLEAINSMRAHLDGSIKHLGDVKKKVESGEERDIDLLRAESLVANDVQKLEATIGSLEKARGMLAYLTGADQLPMPEARLKVFDAAKKVRSPMEGLVFVTTWGSSDQMVNQAKPRRLDLAAGRLAWQQADIQVKTQWMQFLPTVVASWQLNHYFRSPNVLVDDDPTQWLAFASLSIPIFSQSRYTDLDYAKATRQKYAYLLRDAENKASMEVQNARRAFVTAIEQLIRLDKMTGQSRQVLDTAEKNYREGKGTSLEVTDAGETYRQVELALVSKHVEVRLALLKLAFVLGEDILQVYSKAQ